MKTIRVVAAILIDRGRVYATQRGYGEYRDGWEFPGGKIEKNETGEEALKREIMEELRIPIEITSYFDTIEYDYTAFHLSMDCYLAKIASGSPVLVEHEAARWLSKEELEEVNWLPADRTILAKLKEVL
jgi:8-oxo-dGTP diphosphatase